MLLEQCYLYNNNNKKGKTNCNYYQRIPLPLTSYKILSNNILRSLIPDVYGIIEDNQYGFRSNMLC